MLVTIDTDVPVDLRSFLSNDIILSDNDKSTSYYIDNNQCKCVYCDKCLVYEDGLKCDCKEANNESEALRFLNTTRNGKIKHYIMPKLLSHKRDFFEEIKEYAVSCTTKLDSFIEEEQKSYGKTK